MTKIFASFAQIFKNGTALEKLDLSGSLYMGSEDTRAFFEEILFTRIKTLHLSECNFSVNNASDIGKFLTKNETLTQLNLTIDFANYDSPLFSNDRKSFLSKAHMMPIAKGLKNLQVPLELSLNPDCDDMDAWKCLNDALMHDPPVNTLTLSKGGRGIYHLIPSLTRSTNLTRLAVWLDDPEQNGGFDAFCDMLTSHKYIRQVKIGSNGWKTDHLVQIFKAITSNSRINSLGLHMVEMFYPNTLTTNTNFFLTRQVTKSLEDMLERSQGLRSFKIWPSYPLTCAIEEQGWIQKIEMIAKQRSDIYHFFKRARMFLHDCIVHFE